MSTAVNRVNGDGTPLSPDMKALIALSTILSRAEIGRRSGIMFDGERSINTVLGYPDELDYDDFYAKYERQDIAARIIDLYPRATWKLPPVVRDTEENDSESSPFMETWQELIERIKIWKYLERVDRVAGIGEYGILLLGLRDGGDFTQPAGRLSGPDDLLYLAPFSQDNAEIESWVENTQDPRFGRPLTYRITLANERKSFRPNGALGDKITVHHSRIIHVAEDLLEDEVFGRPRLQRCYDRLQDLLKLAGGSAEAFWLIAAPFYHLNIDKDVRVTDADLEELDQQLQDAMHGLRRTLQTQGAESKTLGGGLGVDPSGAYGVLQELIAAAADIPQRVLFGSERGELASTQDQEEWRSRVVGRQTRFAEPDILRPFIDRLVELNILPQPEGNKYKIVWQDLSEPTKKDQMLLARDAAQAAALLSPTQPTLVMPAHEFREQFLGLSPAPSAPPEGAPALEDFAPKPPPAATPPPQDLESDRTPAPRPRTNVEPGKL